MGRVKGGGVKVGRIEGGKVSGSSKREEETKTKIPLKIAGERVRKQ